VKFAAAQTTSAAAVTTTNVTEKRCASQATINLSSAEELTTDEH